MYADDTTIYCIGKSFDEVCLKLNKVFDELRLWSLRSKLSIHPIKTEAMILTKQGFIGPAPPQYCSETSMSALWIILLVWD